MRRCHWLAILTVAYVGFADGRPVRSEELSAPRVLTVRGTGLYRLANNALVAAEDVPPLMEFVIAPSARNIVDTAGVVYRPVRRAAEQVRWVRERDVVAVPAGAPSDRGLPALIAKQPAHVQRAWIEIDKLIRENQATSTPLAHAYLARAEIWATASDYENALEDVLTAFRLSRQAGATLAEQSRMTARLQELLQRLAHSPRPRYFGDADAHYRAGFDAYHSDQLETALRHFDSAVQLAPEDKVSWYYRALTHKRLNDDAAAERDITVAVYLEHSVPGDQPSWWLGQFTRVQGPLRNWMESYRSGLPIARQ